MLDSGRKQELIDELASDIDRYVERNEVVQNFIDCTCQNHDEIEFVRNLQWWVSVVEDENV